jgi:hypothetical protein
MEQTKTGWLGRVRALPCELLNALAVPVKKRYRQLKTRYGPGYTKVMVAAVCCTLFVPIPGISLLAVTLVVAVAEVHRSISRRDEDASLEQSEDGFRHWRRDITI